ncbi:MAG: hypothetical protein U0169_20880 [Polyangiaceae bacterium]
MNTPYVSNFGDAFVIAHTSICATVGAVVANRLRFRDAGLWAFAAALVVVGVAPSLPEYARAFAVVVDAPRVTSLLGVALAFAVVGTAALRAWGTTLVGLLAMGGSWFLARKLTASALELVELHAIVISGLAGAATSQRATRPSSLPETSSSTVLSHRKFLVADASIFLVAMLAATAFAVFVLERRIDSSDEWAYTYQAATFAKFRAYADAPPCADSFQNFWVFQTEGRTFSMYTPGWPLFMAPFIRLFRAPWLAGPAAFGILAVAVARLARRAATSFLDEDYVAPAGVLAALVTTLSTMTLVNAGSRYSHVFVAALFATAMECLAAASTKGRGNRAEFLSGTVLGVAVAGIGASRPADGATLASGLALYALYAVLRGKLSWRACLGGVFGLTLVAVPVLVILRLQIGRWFATGYSLIPLIHPWAVMRFSVPGWDDLKWGFPVATSTYCWWPNSIALGAFGLASLGRSERRLAFISFVSSTALVTLYCASEYGRGYDWGFGPRYVLPLLVPCAVGGGVALARVWVDATREFVPGPPLRTGGGAVLAATAIVLGVVRLAPFVVPSVKASLGPMRELVDVVEKTRAKNALVLIPPYAGFRNGGLDLTQNYPATLYPRADVFYVMEKSPESVTCLRNAFPDRVLLRATRAGAEVRLDPVNPGLPNGVRR